MSEEQAPWGERSNPTLRQVLVEAPWCKMPMALAVGAGWTKTDVAVYAYLDYRAGKRGWFYDTQQSIVEALGSSLTGVKRSIAALKDAGYVDVERTARDGSNTYYVRARVALAGDETDHSWAVPGPKNGLSNGPDLGPLPIRPKTPAIDTSKEPSSTPPEQGVWEYFRAHIQPKARMRPSSLSKIRARLKTYTVDEVTQAIDKFAAHPWWMEHNGHQGAEWFFFDDAKIERWLTLKPPQIVNGEGAPSGGGHNGTAASNSRGPDAPARKPSGLEKYR